MKLKQYYAVCEDGRVVFKEKESGPGLIYARKLRAWLEESIKENDKLIQKFIDEDKVLSGIVPAGENRGFYKLLAELEESK